MKTGTVKMKKRIWALMLSAAIAVTFMPYHSYAETNQLDTAETPAESAFGLSAEPISGSAEAQLDDNDDLLMQYLKNGVNGSPQKRKAGRRETLTSKEKTIYDSLKMQIEDVAAGRRSNTVLTVSITDLFEGKIKKTGGYWILTKSALGVSAVIDSNSNVTDEALHAFNKLVNFDGIMVLDALLYDLPYDFYWFDKTVRYWYNWNASSQPYVYSDGIVFYSEPSIDFTLHVAKDYSAEGKTGTTTTNTTKTAAASACIENVNNIIAKNVGKTPVQKLYAYKDKICALTSYNYEAAENLNPIYGDPWQLIWVFDNDASTKVVCEGYSKAFQFLCDCSELGSIECYTVTGNLKYYQYDSYGVLRYYGDPHMWNILRMDDDKRYIADLTNCDAETPSEPDDQLFLKGVKEGNIEDGFLMYVDWSPKPVEYYYDSDTCRLFYDNELALSFNAYGFGSGCSHVFGNNAYKWSSGYHYMTAKRICSIDGYVDAEMVRTTEKVTNATCETAGSTKYTAKFTNGAFVTQTKTVKGEPALGHDLVEVKARAATIKKAGNKNHWKCKRCGKRFSDSSGKKEISKESVTIPKLDEKRGRDGTMTGKGASAATADYEITNLSKDTDPAGAKFAPLKLMSTTQTKKSITLKWKKNSKAVKYVIYGNKCGSAKPKKITTIKGNEKKISKIAGKKLKKSTYYKFVVVALDKKGYVVSTSKLIHVATKGKANYTGVTTRAKKNRVSLKKGKTFKLGAKAVGKKVKQHVGVRYESSDPKVAKVSKSGKIKALKKGSCKIYVYTQNGICKTIKVTVR